MSDLDKFMRGFNQGPSLSELILYGLNRRDERHARIKAEEEAAAEEQARWDLLQAGLGTDDTQLMGYSIPSEKMSVRPGMEQDYPDAEPTYQTRYTEATPESRRQALNTYREAGGSPDYGTYAINMWGGPSSMIDAPEAPADTYTQAQADLIASLVRGPSDQDPSMFSPEDVIASLEAMGLDPAEFEAEMKMLFEQRPDLLNDMVFPPPVPQEAIYRDMGAATGVFDAYGNLLNQYPDVQGAPSRSPYQYRDGLLFDPNTGQLGETPYYDPTGGRVDTNAITSTITNMQTNGTYQIAESASAKYGVPMEILLAVFSKESGGNTQAIGDGGDSYGIGQLNKVNWEAWDIADPQAFLGNPQAQIEIAASMLKDGFQRYGGWREALRAYNGSGPMAERYADDVWARSQEIKGDFEDVSGPYRNISEVPPALYDQILQDMGYVAPVSDNPTTYTINETVQEVKPNNQNWTQLNEEVLRRANLQATTQTTSATTVEGGKWDASNIDSASDKVVAMINRGAPIPEIVAYLEGLVASGELKQEEADAIGDAIAEQLGV